MADKKFTLTFDVEGNLSPIKGAVKDFQSTIKSAKFQIPVGIQGNIDKTISKLNAEIAEFESLTSQGFSNMADIGKAEKSFAKITSLMRQLGSQGEQIKGLDPKKFLPKEILERTAKLEKAFNKLGDIKINTKKIDAQTDAIKKQKEEVDELRTKYEALAAENKTAGARKGNLSSSIKAKEKEAEAIQQQMKALEQVKGGKSSAEYSKLNSEFKTLRKTIAAQKQEFASLDTSINKNKTTMSGLKVQLDSASSALDQMEESLKQLQASANVNEDLENLRKELAQLKNVNIDEIPDDLDEIKRIIGSLDDDQIKTIKNSLEGMGKAADNLVPSLEKTSKELEKTGQEGKELTRVGQEIENLKGQVLDFFSITNTIQIFKNAVRDAFDTVKELDAVMTETAVVTDFSIGDMWDKLPEYAEQANKLGTSIKDLYAANTLYYQQGLNSQQAMSVGVETMKMARIANMDAAKATEAMTAALRGFNMEINETSASRINDVYSELAAITASDTEQIATAMSKTASIAASANMEFETTAALLAQIIETTQEAPETAGTAMKTIIARFTEVKELFSEGMLTGEDGEGEEININKIDAALKTVGISLKDFLNGTKGIDDIFLELASKWNSLDLATQRYIATTAAGSRQQSRFIAMMSNYDRTMELVTAANNSAGASQKQFGKTLDSLDAKLQRLSNAWDTFVMGLADNDIIKFGVDLLTKLLETVNNLTDDLGGTAGSIAKLGIAIAALKTGKNLFNSIFDITPLKQKLSEATGITGTFAQTLTKMGVKIKTETEENIDAASASMNKFTGGLMAAGVACGALAQYLRSMGMEDFAKGLEIAGGALITVASGFNLVNSIAVAAGTTVPALLSSIGAALLPILPYILAIAAAIGAVVLIAKKIYDKSAAGRLKAAQKDTQKAADAAKEAAEEYNNLNNAISSIADKTEGLQELTKGTQEWRDAVVSLNTEILDLINTYPELASFLSNEGGVLKIDYDKTATNKYGKEYNAQDVLNSYLRKQTETQQIYNQRQIREKQAEIELQFTKTVKDFIGNLSVLDIEKAERESSTGNSWNDAREIVDKLAIEIAKGKVQADEQSLQDWFNTNNLQMRDYEEFDYSVFKTYGNYLLSQQEAINGLTDATIAAHMAMLKLSNVSDEATEAVTNFDENILRDAYNAQLKEAKERSLTEEDKRAYAEHMGYKYETRTGGSKYGMVPEFEYVALVDKNGKTVTQDAKFDQEVRDFIVNRATNEDFTAVLQKMAEHYDNADEKEQELFSEVFADGLQELSFSTLSKYGTFQNGQFGFNQDEVSMDAFAKAMNFKSFDEMAKMLEIAPEQLTKQLEGIFTAGGAEFIKARKNLVKNMTKYSTDNKKDYEANAELLNLLEAKYKDLDVSGILTDVIGRLEATGDEEFSTAAYEAFRDIMMKPEGEAQMKEALHFLESIDLSNPIDALDKINEEIQSGSSHAKELAIAMKQSGGTFLSLSSQLASLTEMADFEDLDEDLEEIIAKNGEIAALDVYDLADSYKSLDKILKNNEMSAAGLAKVLEGIADGTLQIEDLTDTVLAALSSFESLESIATKTVKALEDFDLGIDENTVGETVGEWAELIKENLEKGAVGNSQNFRILDYLFPGWDEGLEGDALVAEMTRLAKKLEGNGQNLRTAWSDLAAGKDYKGNKAVFDGTGMTDEEKAKFDKLSVSDTGSEILFSGWEGKGLTSADLVTWISDAYNVSSEMAAMMLTDFKNYSSDLAVELKENDYAVGIEKAYESLRSFGDLKLVDEQEIKTIAKLLGVSEGTVRTDFESRGATVTQFYDDEGNIKGYQDIKQIMDVDLAGAGTEAGQKWSDSFLSAVAVGNSQSGGLVSTLDMDQLEKELKSLGITGLNADKIKRQAFEAVRDGLGEGAQMGYGKVQEVLANGDTVEVTITPNMSWEEYQQQLTKLSQANENNALAEAIGASVSEAMSAMEITPTIDENTLIEFRSQIESAASEANPQVDVTVSEDSKAAMTTAIDEVTGQQKTIPASIIVNSSNIGSYLYRRTIYVDLKVGNSELPSGGGGTTDGEFATGIQKSPRTYENALTGEEGPELIERADGTAYLTGTAGPEITEVGRGDTVYTADETKDIFKKQRGITLPRYASGYGDGTAYGGSGGKKGGSSDDEDVWENPYDKLYNLVRKIDEELRQRERIERRYEKLLTDLNVSAKQIVSVSREELAQLEKERLLQERLVTNRKSQIEQYQNENSDLTKYGNVVTDENGNSVLRINWDLINSVTDTEKGDRIETYISQLEEWFDSLEEAEEALWYIEDAVEEIKERGEEEYFNLEDAIKEALVQSYQDEIDKLSEINESINDTNSALLDAMQKTLDKQRQERDNKKTEDDLAEKQRRLLYLQQDTSGANAMEILQLQKEIEEGREDYTDTLIDQKISELQDQNDKAAKQREQQITIAQAQLDNYVETGQIWNDVYSLMDEGLDKDTGLVRGSRLEEILKSTDGYSGLSEIGKMEWLNDTNNMIAQALAYLEIGRQLEDIGMESGSEIEFTTSDGRTLTGTVNADGSVTASDGQTYNNVFQGYNGKYYAGENIEQVEEPTVEDPSSEGTEQQPTQNTKYTEDNIIGIAEAVWLKGGQASGWGAGDIRKSRVDQKIGAGAGQEVQTRINQIANKKVGTGKAKKALTEYYYGKFKQGGLADFTGPAWLDGTKSRPELVLNQKDTQNFIQLKDILASIMERGSTSNSSTENNGDITYDIDINVETIGSDYDVEQVANKVKSLIGENARYRNNNTVSLAR